MVAMSFRCCCSLFLLVGLAAMMQLPAAGWGCRGSKPDGQPVAAMADRVSPLPRAIRMEEGSVTLEGRWATIEPEGAPTLLNTVRVVCLRADRACREDLTTAAAAEGSPPTRELADYEVREWIPTRLVAVRRTPAGDDVVLYVSLMGRAATKSVSRKGGRSTEIRWRLE
jgi:hypothetical protein